MENVINNISSGYKTPFHDLHVAQLKKSHEGGSAVEFHLEGGFILSSPWRSYMELLVTSTVSNVST